MPIAARYLRNLLGRQWAELQKRRRSGSQQPLSPEEIEHLKRHGATKVIMGEYLIAQAMIADARAAVAPAPVPDAAPSTPGAIG